MVISNLKFFIGEGGFLVRNSRKGLSGEFGLKIYCLRSTVQKPDCASQIVSVETVAISVKRASVNMSS